MPNRTIVSSGSVFSRCVKANPGSCIAEWSCCDATFRAESINLLNTPQFADPVTDLTSPSFGQITNTLNEGRTFQFQLRFRF